jgi:hypothetical protein
VDVDNLGRVRMLGRTAKVDGEHAQPSLRQLRAEQHVLPHAARVPCPAVNVQANREGTIALGLIHEASQRVLAGTADDDVDLAYLVAILGVENALGSGRHVLFSRVEVPKGGTVPESAE